MRSIILCLLVGLFSTNTHGQENAIADEAQKQQQINNLNQAITADEEKISSLQAAITIDSQEIAAYNASNAQTASGVNWDYFVTLEPQIPFSIWSKVSTGVNWTSIIPTLGINCGGITEANVNWSNWGKCENNGMTPGAPFGGKSTGIAAFWCGNGSISGTC
jgi:hypothetical protein